MGKPLLTTSYMSYTKMVITQKDYECLMCKKIIKKGSLAGYCKYFVEEKEPKPIYTCGCHFNSRRPTWWCKTELIDENK